MNARKTGRLLSLLAGTAVIGMTAAHAAGASAPATAPAKAAASAPAVTVKLGEAMLEEYHNGDPSTRTTTLRGGGVAPRAKTDGGGGRKH